MQKYHWSDITWESWCFNCMAKLSCLSNSLFSLTIMKTSNHALLVFVRGIHWSPVDSPHKGPVIPKMFPCHDVIMYYNNLPVQEQLIHETLLDNRTIIGCRFSKASMDKLAISLSHIWDKNIPGTINCYYGQIYDLSGSFVFNVFTITGRVSQ